MTTGEGTDYLQEGPLLPWGGIGTVLPDLLTFQKNSEIKVFCNIFLFLKTLYRPNTIYLVGGQFEIPE